MKQAIIKIMLLGVCSLLCCSGLLAADGASAEPPKITSGAQKEAAKSPEVQPEAAPVPLVTVEWRDKPLRAALEYIAEVANVNIVVDFTITSEDVVTVTFRNLDWKLALETTVQLGQCVLDEITPVLYRVSKPPLVTMEFKNTPLEEVIRAIAKLANINIIIAADVRGSVTMMMQDVPWMEALQNIIKTTGFAIVQEKYNVIRIIKMETLQEQLETRFFQLKYLRPPTTFKASITTSYAVGTPKASGDPVKEFSLLIILKNMLTKKGGAVIGSLEYDPTNNTIIIKDTKPVLDEIQKVIDRMDVSPAQILVELKFVNTSNDDLLRFGLRWGPGGQTDQIGARTGLTTGTSEKTTSLPFGLGRVSTPYNPWYLTSYDINATMRLFKQDTKSRIIQEPTLLTLHGQEATVFVGQSTSFAQTTATAGQSGGLAYSIGEATKSPAKSGFQLWVLPYVIKDTNQVMMTVIPQLESLVGSGSPVKGFTRYALNSGQGEQYIDLPQIQQSTLVVNLLLESGQGAIIGGLSRDEISKDVQKVPYLGDIPLLSTFFTYKEDSLTTTHLLVFITPHIIKNAADTNTKLAPRIEQTEKILDKK